jgi:hypothetical protein
MVTGTGAGLRRALAAGGSPARLAAQRCLAWASGSGHRQPGLDALGAAKGEVDPLGTTGAQRAPGRLGGDAVWNVMWFSSTAMFTS